MRKSLFFQDAVILLSLSILIFGCSSSDGQKEGNHLVGESSPYLLQHANNPVDWYPWGDEALNKAKEEDKPIIVSIGYAACHWCHVMERKSFEDSTIAAYMNEHFVSIKVDREERPDIDQVYMDAAQLISGRGGWPLNAFALPTGEPFFAGTYFEPDQWLDLLKQVNERYQNDRKALEENAQRVANGIREIDAIEVSEIEKPYLPNEYGFMIQDVVDKVDFKWGGLDRSPKFPVPSVWELLLQADIHDAGEEAREAVETTLDEMISGGMYDQIGGGFARYSVDRKWFAPHFEKMLYDNGQLLSLYAHAYQSLGKERYAEVVRQTIAFANRELREEQLAYFSSLNADSEGEEGLFYTWTYEELERAFDEDELRWIEEKWGVTKRGNWEDERNILTDHLSVDRLAEKFDLDSSLAAERVSSLRNRLFELRSKKVRPSRDEKVLCSWNALMCRGLIDAYQALQDTAYRNMAIRQANFVLDRFAMENGGLYRNFKDGQASIPAFLDDYAYWIRALIDLYQVTFEEKYLQKARDLTSHVLKNFSDSQSQLFFYTSDQQSELITRKIELVDNVQPSSNAVMAENLYLLGMVFDRPDWTDRSQKMVNTVLSRIRESPQNYSYWAKIYGQWAHNYYEIAILGPEAQQFQQQMNRQHWPNAIFIGGENEGTLPLLEDKLQEGQTTIYVCMDKVCRLPVRQPQQAIEEVARWERTVSDKEDESED